MNNCQLLQKILKEPLLHFLILGGFLFTLNAYNNGKDANTTVLVDAQKITQLQLIFKKTWKRAPSREELEHLVDNFILDEIYYREALALGLDQGDVIIKRRLKQKLEFISADMMNLLRPSDGELGDYLNANEEKFTREANYSFEQIYINPDEHQDPDTFLITLLNDLAQSKGDAGRGDPTLLPRQVRTSSLSRISSIFGQRFAQGLQNQDIRLWAGPITSSFGLHLVYIEQKEEARLPDVQEIRSTLVAEWTHEKQQSNKQELDKRLRENYLIIIDWPNVDSKTTRVQGN